MKEPVSMLTIEDDRLLLRPFTLDDVPAVTAACQDREIVTWTASIPWPYEEAHARAWIETHDRQRQEGAAFPFAIIDRQSGHLVGSIGIQRPDPAGESQVGYWVAAWARNQGVASRALELITTWAFEHLLLDRLHLVTLLGNVRSERVAQKAGYRLVGEVADYVHHRDRTRTFQVKRWERRVGG